MQLSEEAKEARRAYQREYNRRRQKNNLQYQREWRQRNKEKVREYNRRYWERKADNKNK